MGYMDKFRRKVLADGDSMITQNREVLKRTFESMFSHAPNSEVIKVFSHEGDMTEVPCIIDDIRELDDRLPDDKEFLFPADTEVEVGYTFEWANKRWISIIREDNPIASHIATRVRPCNYFVKWIDDNGLEHGEWGYVSNKTLYSDGVRDTDVAVIPAQKMHIMMPYNRFSKNIERDKRIMLFEDTYEVTNIDRTINGLIQFILTEAPTSQHDDRENYIADANLRKTHTINVVNGLYFEMLVDKESQLRAEIIDEDGGVVKDVPFEYTALTPAVATVTPDGLVTSHDYGLAEIEIRYEDIATIVQVQVTPSATYPAQIILYGNATIKAGTTETYEVELFKNGKEVTNAEVTFRLADSFGVALPNNGWGDDTSIARIISQDNEKVRIRAGRDAVDNSFRIIATDGDGGSNIKVVDIVSMFG